MEIRAIDLFCGAGGLTRGLLDAGIDVRLGVDNDPACRYPYEVNNGVPFLLEDVRSLSPRTLRKYLGSGGISVLVGCAPCQAFSTYNVRRAHKTPHKFSLVRRFVSLVEGLEPDIVAMENVPYLSRKSVFPEVRRRLERAGYQVWWSIVDARFYGVPQARRRLVLLAYRLGEISLVRHTRPSSCHWKTVRETIASLPRLSAGEQDPDDPVHVASKLSELNLRRIKVTRPGQSWRDWPEELVADCHSRDKGKRYVSVYGRMEWDKPAPTITTQCFGFGNGRFGHPEQDRGISLREAALLQTFPSWYRFVPEGTRPRLGKLGQLIGNAVPVRLGEIIGRSIIRSLEST